MGQGFPGGSAGEAPACNVGDLGSIPGLGRSPGGGNGNPLKYSCLKNFHGLRSLVGYSLWGRKESDRLSDFTWVNINSTSITLIYHFFDSMTQISVLLLLLFFILKLKKKKKKHKKTQGAFYNPHHNTHGNCWMGNEFR